MTTQELIKIEIICENYEVPQTFLEEISQSELIHIQVVEKQQYIHHDEITSVEKMVNLYHNLGVNVPGIEVIMHLLDRVENLQSELSTTKKRLNIWEQ